MEVRRRFTSVGVTEVFKARGFKTPLVKHHPNGLVVHPAQRVGRRWVPQPGLGVFPPKRRTVQVIGVWR